jgi:hypothetical protein
MASTLPELDSSRTDELPAAREGQSPELVLQQMLPDEYAWSYRTLALTGFWAILFMYFSYTPLFFSDIWGHVNYGLWMLEHGRLPIEDPFTPLAEGVPVICTAWGGQVLFALAVRLGGDPFVSNLFAVTTWVTMLVLVRAFYHRSGNLLAAHLGLLLVAIFIIGRHGIVRPEIFGGLSFAVLLWLVSRTPEWSLLRRDEPDDRSAWALWIGTPLLFVFWANTHGSWVVGLALLAGCFAGRVLETAWTAGVSAVLTDRRALRWLLLTELAAAAVLVNPYGIDLYINVLTFGSNPNLKDVLEWYQLKLLYLEGLSVMAGAVITFALWRHSPRPVRVAEVLLLALFTLLVAQTVRMVNWLGPIYAWAMAAHVGWLVEKTFAASPRARSFVDAFEHRSFRISALCLLVGWLGFAFSPASDFLLAAKPRSEKHLYAIGTPLEAMDFLRKHPPTSGMVLTPQWWGDFAIYKGPPGVPVVMNTNAVHVAPRRVWQDYLTMANHRTNWTQTLDRYAVNTVFYDKAKQATLIPAMKRQAAWKKIYEDDTATIFGRKTVWKNQPVWKTPEKDQDAEQPLAPPATEVVDAR